MAGHHYQVSLDPAIQKLNAVVTGRNKFFRWTPRTARIAFTYAVVIPGALTYVAYSTDGKYDFRAKRRGDLVSEY